MLLDQCERDGEEYLRVWSPTSDFVVLGRGNNADLEVDLSVCRERGIPVLRRISGGGAVVLGHGCLCYSLVLRMDTAPELISAQSANGWILRRSARVLGAASGREVEIMGDSDLTVAGRKIAGHAQRRRRHALLLHGSVILDFKKDCMPELLRVPSRMPLYRAKRKHLSFVINLGCEEDAVKHELRKEWQAVTNGRLDEAFVRLRAEQDYGRSTWCIVAGEPHRRCAKV